ncbi:MAG: hypothetical protein ACK55I_47650, partial [bacterium]
MKRRGKQPGAPLLSPGQRLHLQLIHLLAQRHALAGPQRLPPLLGRELQGIQIRLRKPGFLEAIAARREILPRKLPQDALPIRAGSGMEPADRFHRRLIQGLVRG